MIDYKVRISLGLTYLCSMKEIHTSKHLMRGFDSIQYFAKERHRYLTEKLFTIFELKVKKNIQEPAMELLRDNMVFQVKKRSRAMSMFLVLTSRMVKKYTKLEKLNFLMKLQAIGEEAYALKDLDDETNGYQKSIYSVYGKGLKHAQQSEIK